MTKNKIMTPPPPTWSAHRSFLLVAQRQQVVKIDLSEANSSMVLPLIGVEVSAHRSFLLVAQRQQVVNIDLSEANSYMVLPLIGVEVSIYLHLLLEI